MSPFLPNATIILLAAIISTAAAVTPSHTFLRSSCISARHPDLCISSITASASLLHSISSPKDVIHASLNLTLAAVRRSIAGAKIISARPSLTSRERAAVQDCLEMFDETLDELRRADADLRSYPPGLSSSKSLSRHAADLKIMISGAITNQESCADGFSHASDDRRLRVGILKGLTHIERMCENALSMIRNMTDGDMAAAAAAEGRKLASRYDGFPEWMTAGDRRLLQSAEMTADVTVAADGSGNFNTITEAVAAAPVKSKRRFVIKIKAGVYAENVEVPKNRTNIMFVGDGRTKTMITGSRNVVDGWTTFRSATLAAVGSGFLARDLRVENTAGPSKHQAVALRVGSDLSAFYNCDIIAHQDTLYVHSLRQFFRSCLIQGTVDFIFGNAAAVFQDCDIQARKPGLNQMNMVTAQGRSDPDEPTGIVLQSCRIAAAEDLETAKDSFPSYLGRPWKAYSRTVVLRSEIGDFIRPEGWHEWNLDFGLDTLYYGEYENTGPGAGTARRVDWKGHRVIVDAGEAQQFTVGSFLEGSDWLGATGFPFSLGL
ncbi:hypothetical protein IEQ34_011100 [Dendrobium chrysotoxum]|uniref:Pectinesterase n=1 Tax=Dendrobium chrysotoxum TaxID=161865 RepID=A0AAV7GVC8_DENCH|nr:hypothetical protein IEQ34_011100 [Dendrobium chrysotoxum]